MASDANPYFDSHIASSSSHATNPATTAVNPGNAGDLATPSTPLHEQPPTTVPPTTVPPTTVPPTTVLPASLARAVRFRPVGDRQQSSIRLRRGSVAPAPAPRLETIPSDRELDSQPQQQAETKNGTFFGRARSNSGKSFRLPKALSFNRMPTIQDGGQPSGAPDGTQGAEQTQPQNLHATRPGLGAPARNQDEYADSIVDFLDVIDPEVATLSSITNVQNSLFVPSLGRFINRRPTYDISFLRHIPGAFPEASNDEKEEAPREPLSESQNESPTRQPTLNRTFSITSELTDSHYAVLPSGGSLEGWSQEDVDQLNDHVRHMLHSRRSKLKRTFKAFGKYVRRPLGFLVTLYATLITLFGLAWVLFLIGWIYVGPEKQSYTINVIDNVLVALFAIVGDGLAPFRAVDTYHMFHIVRYHRLTWKLRKRMRLPELENKNDLPTDGVTSNNEDLEAGKQDEDIPDRHEVSVLSEKQQERVVHHQNKMAKSHTFYKPHETETHYAFPLNFLIAIVLLLDLHSCLQISLGSVTWSIDYHVRSAALTTTILCCSITANTLAGVLISIGDRRTRKKDVIERMLRQELTDYAMRKVQKEKKEQEEKEVAARKDVTEAGRFDFSTHFSPVSSGDAEKDEIKQE